MHSSEYIGLKNMSSCVDKNIQVFRKKRTHRHKSKIDKNIFTVCQQHDAENSRKGHHKDYGRHSARHSPCKASRSSEDISSEEDYNDMCLIRKAKFTSNRNIHRRNSDISDYVTIMAMEYDQNDVKYSESTSSTSKRASVSESNLQNSCKSKCCPANRPKNSPIPPCYIVSAELITDSVCPHCRNLMKDSCPLCSEGMRKLTSKSKGKKNRKNSNQASNINCCDCDKGGGGSNEESFHSNFDRRDGRCPPCGLCPEDCTTLKMTQSEEQMAMEREMARCDCKTKILKQRLLKAFNVCPKCRQPKYLCHCLEEMIMEYKLNPTGLTKIDGSGGSSGKSEKCTCKDGIGDDSLAKLLYEVTNTCPKCGHRRKSCTCLEEILWDVKRMLTKQNLADENDKFRKLVELGGNRPTGKCGPIGGLNGGPNGGPNGKNGKGPCGCQCQSKRDTEIYFEEVSTGSDLKNDSGCLARGTQVFEMQTFSHDIETRFSKQPMSKTETHHQQKRLEGIDAEMSCDCVTPVIACQKCKLPEIICECKFHSKNKKERELHAIKKSHRTKASEVDVYCECSVEKIPCDSHKVNICEECLRPQYNCVCKQSPTCFKCGKQKDEESDMRRTQENRQKGAASERSRSSRQNRHEAHSARVTSRYAPRSQNDGCRPSGEAATRGRDSKLIMSIDSLQTGAHKTHAESTGTKYISVSPRPKDKDKGNDSLKNSYNNVFPDATHAKKEDKGVSSSSQSAFQKLRSHFLRCKTCGKRHTKREYECRQIQCNTGSERFMPNGTSPDSKSVKSKHEKCKKKEKESKECHAKERRRDSAKENILTKNGLVNVILPPQEQHSEESLTEYGQDIIGK